MRDVTITGTDRQTSAVQVEVGNAIPLNSGPISASLYPCLVCFALVANKPDSWEY